MLYRIARPEFGLEAAINRRDRFELLILDDLAYVTKDQAETSVLFELISDRYERRSMLITANRPFGEWGKVFPDPAMTLAAVDRLVHHATIGIVEVGVLIVLLEGQVDRSGSHRGAAGGEVGLALDVVDFLLRAGESYTDIADLRAD